MFDASQLEKKLTEREVLLRDAFVGEYLKDFDAVKACLRIGFQPTYATTWEKIFREDGYVQRKIAHMTAIPAATPEQEATDRAMVETTLRLVMQRGSDSARVAAAGKFMILKGWDKQDDVGDFAAEGLADQFRRVAEQLPT